MLSYYSYMCTFIVSILVISLVICVLWNMAGDVVDKICAMRKTYYFNRDIKLVRRRTTHRVFASFQEACECLAINASKVNDSESLYETLVMLRDVYIAYGKMRKEAWK